MSGRSSSKTRGMTVSVTSIPKYAIGSLLIFSAFAFLFFSNHESLSGPIRYFGSKSKLEQCNPTEGRNAFKLDGSKQESKMAEADKLGDGNDRPQEKEESNALKHNGNESANQITQKSPSCVLGDRRFELCKIDTNVRIVNDSYSVFYATSDPKENRTWHIKPYPRKFDHRCMNQTRIVTIAPMYDPKNIPECRVYHNITAVMFHMGKFTGSFYHSFVDFLVPLFITSYQFNGEVQFIGSDIMYSWVNKFKTIINSLTNYDLLDLTHATQPVHCYPRAIVGLYRHYEMSMEPSLTPNNITMADFTKHMRKAFKLKRDSAISLRDNNNKKPRLLILKRTRCRLLTNIDEVVPMAEQLGFEVAVNDSSNQLNMDDFARTVNSFDVMMGVHGAGIVNEIFLPTNAVLIQIVPFGLLEGVSRVDFGWPAEDMKLKYLQYSISIDESSLINEFPRNHSVFKHPWEYLQKQLAAKAGHIYLSHQDVKLNLTRFKPVLVKALEHLSL